MRIGCIRTGRNRARVASVTVVAGLAFASVAAGAVGVAEASPPARTSSAAPTTPAATSAVTVPAPGADPGATVTVSKTAKLVNQTVLVSWTGFRPSSDTRLANAGDSLDVNTQRPVRVYQCRGTNPASSSECYGSPGFRGIPASPGDPGVPAVPAFTYPGQTDVYDATPDGPPNWQDNVTRADGTGEVSVQLFTKRESAALGCDAVAPCSIVVVPNYGRPQGDTEDQMDAPWAWANSTVVPLSFLTVGDACPLSGTTLRVEGSPVVAGVLASWRARTCTLDSDDVNVDYTAIGEPQVRQDLGSATTNVGLTLDPLPKKDAKAAGIVYAPVAVTGLVVAFQIDDAKGRPIADLKLNPRLVAKLVTGSYRSGGNGAVINNPVNLFHDPELQALNPTVLLPRGAPGNHPLILGDLSDTTEALTAWLAADPEAAAFLKGTPDPWGMTVNSNYKDVALPFSSFPLLDQLMSDTYAPIQQLDQLARQLSIAQFPGALTTVENGVNVTVRPPRQNPGSREVIGIIDATSAARFRLSTASLENAGGAFVRPTSASMLAGVRHSTVNPDGVTRTVDQTDTATSIYPLSLLVSAGLSTKAPKSERRDMVDLLDYVAGEGQTPGDDVGQLPEGNAPLDAKLVSLVDSARKEVLAGYQEPDPSPSPSPSPSPTDASDAPSDAGGAVPDAVGPAPTAGDPTQGPALNEPSTSLPAPEKPTLLTVAAQLAGNRLIALPLLAILALLSVAVGPTLLWMSHTGRGPQWLRR